MAACSLSGVVRNMGMACFCKRRISRSNVRPGHVHGSPSERVRGDEKRYTDLAKEKLGTDVLDTQIANSIRFYCMGAVGMTQEWVLNDNVTSAETVVILMFNSMPEILRKIYF